MIGATHGNELLGTKLYARLLQKRSPLLAHVDFVVGNPRAYAAKKRYIECDLNRSYQSEGSEYEIMRAQEIKHYIAATKPDIVLDMHTTTCNQANCLIVSDVDGEAKRRLLRASHIENIVQVESLGDIASLGDFVVGYEVPSRSIDNQLLDDIASDLQRFVDGDGIHVDKKLYKMTGKIYKKDVTDEQAKTLVNFELHPLGYVPILTGENSYKRQTDYLGFKSPAAKHIKI